MSGRTGESLKVDTWPWGIERVVWGFEPGHQFTFKLLEPKRGRAGCMSLQYHHEKSELWMVLRGEIWALVVVGDQVCTRIMGPGDIQTLPVGTIHRMMGLSDDARVAEPSTPDRHAADKSVAKDVVRLHCYQGRAVAQLDEAHQRKLVARCVELSDQAVAAVERGVRPDELNSQLLIGHGAYRVD